MKKIGEVVTFFEENRTTQVRGHGAKVLYRFTSEYEEIRMRLKLEINCREHFNVRDWVDFPFEVDNDWFSGKADIKTYTEFILKCLIWFRKNKPYKAFKFIEVVLSFCTEQSLKPKPINLYCV